MVGEGGSDILPSRSSASLGMFEKRRNAMIENEFRRIALAQGLPRTVPLARSDDGGLVLAHNPAVILRPGAPADNPAIAEQHTQSA
jgi:hypothetical protein